MKYFFIISLVLVAFTAQSMTIEQYVEHLQKMKQSVQAANGDQEANSVVAFYNREFLLDNKNVIEGILTKNTVGVSSCSCCANCNNPDFYAPCEYYEPKCHCLRPCGNTDAVFAAMCKNPDFDTANDSGDSACCAWLMCPVIDPVGYLAVGFFGALEYLYVAAQGGTNRCARAFPLWTKTGSVRERAPAKVEIIARIDCELRKHEHLRQIDTQPGVDVRGAPPQYGVAGK